MKLPTKFEEILKNDQRLHGAVYSTLSTFEPWLKQNYLPFFPEYTDHSERHVEEVLVATQALIRDEAWDIISPEDAAVLSLAVLVHDSGMHLSEDGFISLVSVNTSQPSSSIADEPTWSQLWFDFLGEASRFDARKLKQLFGDDKPVRKPPLDAQEMTRRDRMLIGEFLRRHHPRLAREIALNGVPGPGNAPFTFQNVPEHIAHLAGLVAHSHGVSLRDAAEWLKPEQRRTTRGVHVPFLMALLRIADYLQIQQERAPTEVLRVRSLRSPISQGEWNAHNAVKDIDNSQDDIEAIYIDAEPKDVKTFLKLKNLFSSIQRELDTSWAVLGEVYAIHPKLSSLGLNGLVIRRVRSNLDKVQEFGETVSYIPEKVSLQTANAELVNLLIEPLYGASPEIGVRELLQNAVDACRELEDYQKENIKAKLDLPRQKADVRVELSSRRGKKNFRIQDKGIGMTIQTIKNYFLTAGASFRMSDVWKAQHTDEKGNSKVLRSGRFGIGALAAFLIGDEVRVTTRHVSQPEESAIQFTFRVNDETIELCRTKAKVGTAIDISIVDDKVWRSLTDETHSRSREVWKWYYLKQPSVSFFVEGREMFPSEYFPSPGTSLPSDWRSLPDPEDYQVVHWSLREGEAFRSSPIACNGIVITDEYRHNLMKGDDSLTFALSSPKMSIFDKDAKLPVNLERTELRSLPFEASLQRDVAKDLVAYALVQELQSNLNSLPTPYPLHNSYRGFLPWLLFGKDGYVLADKWLITHIGFKSVISTAGVDFQSLGRAESLINSQAFLTNSLVDFESNTGHRYREGFKGWLRENLGRIEPEPYKRENNSFFGGARILMPTRRNQEFWVPKTYRKELREAFICKEQFEGWVLLEGGSLGDSGFDFETYAQTPPDNADSAILETYFDVEKWIVEAPSLVGGIWKEVIGDVVIPYRMEERKRLLSYSFEMLDEYIQKHLALAEERKTQSPST